MTAVSDGDVVEGISAVGAPIFDFSGQARAALSIAGIREGHPRRRLRRTGTRSRGAHQISRQLGFDPAHQGGSAQ
jgi:DNA-binding IclR family transcriptional regulator